MPRPKPKDASPNFTAEAHSLSEGARTKLIELLGYGKDQFSPENTDVGEIIIDVQTWLGAYPQVERNVDRAPRAADYVAAFKPMHREAVRLLNRFTSLNPYFRDQFKLKGADIFSIEGALRSMVSASSGIVKEFESQSSKGARRNFALTEVIRYLRLIFRNHYRGPRGQRPRRGPFEKLSVQQSCELDFVDTALRDARIIRSSFTKKELLRLFKDSRCFPDAAPPLIHPADADRRAKAAMKELGVADAPIITSAFQAEQGEPFERIARKARHAPKQKRNAR